MVADLSDRSVSVYVDGRRVARFPAGFGYEGVGKERRGDNRSPAGIYRLHAGRPSRYHRFLPVSYPNSADADRGLRQELVTPAQHRAILRADRRGRMTPQWTKLGGQIGVHGFGDDLRDMERDFREAPRDFVGSRGCIMIQDDHIDELERLVEPGVMLIIRP